MKINNNMSAVIANGQLKKAENRVAAAVERLSSGLRINHAGDDPAGMAISQKMKSQIRGLGRASDNSADGVSVIETAEGALTEVHAILNRMRELAVQSASDTNEAVDSESIQKEIDSLTVEVDRIAKDTEFNGVNLLDGSLDYRGYTDVSGVNVLTFAESVPTDKEYIIKVTTQPQQAKASGGVMQGITSEAQEGALMLNGEIITFKKGDTADDVLGKIRTLANRVGISVSGGATGYEYVTDAYGSAARVDFRCENPDLATALGLDALIGNPTYGIDTAISFEKGFEDTASYSATGTRVEITDRNGFSIEMEVDPAVEKEKLVTLDIMDIGGMNLQIGANENEVMVLKIPATTCHALDIENLNFLSREGSGEAITTLDEAIGRVSSTRASLGAYQNRLEHTISSLDIAEENMTSAMSRIEDVDMAEEMSEYTAASVIQQAGISVLGQANDVPQMVLQLLN